MSWFTTCSENSKPENIGNSGEPGKPIDHKLLSSFMLRTELHFSCNVNIQSNVLYVILSVSKSLFHVDDDDDDGQK